MSLQEAMAQALTDLRDPFLQRLIAAGANPAEAERLMGHAMDELFRTERPSVRRAELYKRFLKEVEKKCLAFAELRRIPYRRVAPVLTRHWRSFMDFSSKAGISSEEAFGIMRDLLWKHAERWSSTENLETDLLSVLKYGFRVVGLTSQRRQ
jgi:hypothetical protein